MGKHTVNTVAIKRNDSICPLAERHRPPGEYSARGLDSGFRAATQKPLVFSSAALQERVATNNAKHAQFGVQPGPAVPLWGLCDDLLALRKRSIKIRRPQPADSAHSLDTSQAVELAQELADTLCLPCAAEPSAMATATAPAKGGPRTRPQTQFLRLRGTKRALLRHGPPNHRSETLHLSTQQTPSPETSVVSFKSFDTEEESRESTDRLHLSASAAALKDLPASAIYCTTDTFLSATAPALPDPRKLRELLMDAEGKSDRKKEQQRRANQLTAVAKQKAQERHLVYLRAQAHQEELDRTQHTYRHTDLWEGSFAATDPVSWDSPSTPQSGKRSEPAILRVETSIRSEQREPMTIDTRPSSQPQPSAVELHDTVTSSVDEVVYERSFVHTPVAPDFHEVCTPPDLPFVMEMISGFQRDRAKDRRRDRPPRPKALDEAPQAPQWERSWDEPASPISGHSPKHMAGDTPKYLLRKGHTKGGAFRPDHGKRLKISCKTFALADDGCSLLPLSASELEEKASSLGEPDATEVCASV